MSLYQDIKKEMLLHFLVSAAVIPLGLNELWDRGGRVQRVRGVRGA